MPKIDGKRLSFHYGSKSYPHFSLNASEEGKMRRKREVVRGMRREKKRGPGK
jgi:hypothetical protein